MLCSFAGLASRTPLLGKVGLTLSADLSFSLLLEVLRRHGKIAW